MVAKFSFKTAREADILIVSISGYLENTGGTELKQAIDSSLQEGVLRYILDFRTTELISSPGVAALLDVSSRIVDDFDGKIVAFGLDAHHSAVLEMSGFFFMVTQAADLDEARTSVKD